jgi:hypothetical protein
MVVMFISFVSSGTNPTANGCVPAQVVLVSSLPAATMPFRVFACIFKTCCTTSIYSWVEAIRSVRAVRL